MSKPSKKKIIRVRSFHLEKRNEKESLFLRLFLSYKLNGNSCIKKV